MSSLPEEIVFEILLRVSVKSTIICKSVCKSWLSILSDPDFVKMHLDITTQRNKYNLIFESCDGREGGKGRPRCSVKCISMDSLPLVRGSESEIVKAVDFPFGSYSRLKFLGSCNGLVCIWCEGAVAKRVVIFFCNPATKEYKMIILPALCLPELRRATKEYQRTRLPELRDSYLRDVSAFGYDCKADDYKLIILDEHINVYALAADAWKKGQIVPYKFPNIRQTGMLVNGAFHWLGQAREENSSELIVRFDFNNEKLDELQLPEDLLKKKEKLSMTIGVLEECLCAFATVSKVSFEVWVMQDYGVHESWTRCYVFVREPLTCDYALRLMSSLRDGQILMKTGYELFIYDPKRSSGGKARSSCGLRIMDGVDYVESLVSPNSDTYAGKNKMKRKNMDINKHGEERRRSKRRT